MFYHFETKDNYYKNQYCNYTNGNTVIMIYNNVKNNNNNRINKNEENNVPLLLDTNLFPKYSL